MAGEFYIKQNDRLPDLQVNLLDGDGAEVNLSTAVSVRFIMKTRVNATTSKVDAAANVITPLEGEVNYGWAAGDTDTPGTFYGEFEVTFPGGRTETFPNDGYLRILVTAELD